MDLVSILVITQLVFGAVIGLYFWNLLKNQRSNKVSIDKESKKQMKDLTKRRSVALTKPLSELIRPKELSDVVGQQDGIQALRAALCGRNPQHVIIYGPPGVGKTAAARIILEEAKRFSDTPFRYNAPFVEIDATTARFDERGIADPLIGSVHDPIYQGAGAMGQAGVPQPKKGAVSDAHGGILFIDEIGELHSIQMNKLLKVLEDRTVFYESAYYSEENENIPLHVHEIFKKGLPSDFRLVGATTRSPEDIPPAIRSRCLEVFFRELEPEEIMEVATKASNKVGCTFEKEGLHLLSQYARNGREAVNLVQIASSIASKAQRESISKSDVEWVAQVSRLSRRVKPVVTPHGKVGRVNGLAVQGPDTGFLLEIEIKLLPSLDRGKVLVTGIAEEETIGNQTKSIRRKSMAKGSIENVITMLRSLGVPAHDYDIHVDFPGGIPVDGPSAGLAMAAGIFSSVHRVPLRYDIAITGEVSIHGDVKPVGGIMAKIKAAKQAGAKKVIIPHGNYSDICEQVEEIEVIPVTSFEEILPVVMTNPITPEWHINQLGEDRARDSI